MLQLELELLSLATLQMCLVSAETSGVSKRHEECPGDISSVQETLRVSRSVQECPGVSRSVQECPRLLDTEQSLLVLPQNPPEQTEAAQETPAGLRNVQCVTYCSGKIIFSALGK